MEKQLLGATDPGPSGVSPTQEKEIDYPLEVTERKANNCQDFLDREQGDGEKVVSSEEEDAAAEEGSGVETEDDDVEDVAGSSRGDGDAVGEVAASQSWYRPKQHKKGRRGRGGRKNKSRKRRKDFYNEKKAEGALDGGPSKPETNKGKNMHAAYNQLMRSDNGPTRLTATSRSTQRLAGSVGNSSYSESRPSNSSSESAITTNSLIDRPGLFGDRPRNRPRPGLSRRQASAARYARGRAFDDFDSEVHVVVASFPTSIIEAMLYNMALRRRFRDLGDAD